jgi:P27 family predicted phage terminase small subunit
MGARKPKPTALTVLEGPGRRPRRSAPRPTCPAHLSEAAREEWERLVEVLDEIGVLTRADRGALAAYCQAYGRWVEAELKLAATPPILKTPAGYLQVSPWMTVANRQMELMARFMGELGLTPAARSRLAVERPRGPRPWEYDPAAEFLD